MESEERTDNEDLVLLTKNFKCFSNMNSNGRKVENSNQKASNLMCFSKN